MSKHTQTSDNDIGSLAEGARELIAATADVAGEKVGEARKRLAAALEKAKEMAGDLGDKAVAGARATDKAINENPYKAMAIALGVGAIIGYLIGCKSSGKKE